MRRITARLRGSRLQRSPERQVASPSTGGEQPAVHSTSVVPTASNVAALFPEGIIELHACDDAIVDVCFVNRLTGDIEGIWTAKGEEKSRPQLLLPARLKQARILS